MKNVVLLSATASDAKAVCHAVAGLSGVVAADLSGCRVVAHCGDELDEAVLVREAAKAGFAASVESSRFE